MALHSYIHASKSLTLSGRAFPSIITVFHVTGKQRRKGEWREVNRFYAKCDLFPNAEWWPCIDWGTKTISGSFEGWELNEPEFKTIEKIVEEMLFAARGWKLNDGEKTV